MKPPQAQIFHSYDLDAVQRRWYQRKCVICNFRQLKEQNKNLATYFWYLASDMKGNVI